MNRYTHIENRHYQPFNFFTSKILLVLLFLFLAIGNAFAQPGEALDFDGTDDYADIGDVVEGFSAITFEAWVNPRSYGGDRSITDKEFVSIFSILGDKLHSDFGTGTGWHTGASHNSTGTIPLNTWTHVAVTWDGTKVRHYLNGVLDSEIPFNPGGAIGSNSLPRFVGAKEQSNTVIVDYFDGRIDVLRIWNYAKCPLEVSGHRDCFVPPGFPNLVALYHFDQGIAGANNAGVTTLTDDGPSGFTGTLMNFALTGATSNWVVPGGSGFLGCELIDLPEIKIEGNGIEITDGDSAPSAADLTDFGSVTTGGSITRTFTISDTGFGDLNLNGTPLVAISGPGAAFFTVTSLPTTPIVSAGSTPFQVQFSPTSPGIQAATLSIENDDCDEDPYNFDIQGEGGDVGEALDFDGSTDFVHVPNSASLTMNSALTMEAMVNPKSYNFQGMIANKEGEYEMAIFSAGIFRYAIRNTSPGWVWVNTGFVVPLNSWTHFAVTYDGTNALAYANGTLIHTQAASGPIGDFNPGVDDLRIGWRLIPNGESHFPGKIDEVRIWNRALCASEIASQMSCEITGTETGLAAYYQFNEGVANGSNAVVTNLPDITSNNNDGTLNNFALTGATSNWVAPAGVAGACGPLLPAEMAVKGNGVEIADGDTTPSIADDTDFGSINLGSSTSKIFTIENTGTGNLTLSGSPKVEISGPNAADFSVTLQPTSPVGGGGGTTPFTVLFNPSALGLHTATLSIPNNDCDENPYNFNIQGTGINPLPDIPTIGGNDNICLGTPSTLSITGGNLNCATQWQWYEGSCGGLAVGTGTSITVNPITTTTYFARGEGGCVTTPGACASFTATVNALPTANAIGNSPVCFGETINLDETAGEAVSWQWDGPDGFSSTLKNPAIPNAALTAQGTYNVTITDGNGCTGADAVSITINLLPFLEFDNNSPVCEGESLSFFETGGQADSWSWMGPAGFNSANQNPGITNATPLNSGTYFITITGINGCTQNSSIEATVQPAPNVAVSSNAPLCEGLDLQLFESGNEAVSWSWTGPNGFTSSLANPIISSATLANAGDYNLIASSANGCETQASISVGINLVPNILVGSNSPVAQGGSIELTESGGDAVSWAWNGPNGFVSSFQNPTLNNVTAVEGGTYSVTITHANGCTNLAVLEVVVGNLAAVVSNSGPICESENVQLFETGGTAVSWMWTGPNGFTSNEQNPVISNANSLASGTYSVTITNSVGETISGSTEVEIHPLPNAAINTAAAQCVGADFNLMESGGDAISWAWTGPNGFASSSQTIPFSNANATQAGTYSVTITDANGCINTTSTEVEIFPLPTVVASSNSPVPLGGALQLEESGGEAVSWQWQGPNNFSSTLQNPSLDNATADATGTYLVTITDANGCMQSTDIQVVVSDLSVVIFSNSPLCEGENLQLNEVGGIAEAWQWTGPIGFSSNEQSPVLSSISAAAAGTYSVTITAADGDTFSASLEVEIHENPAPIIVANPPFCESENIQLMETGGTATNWQWSGPKGFASGNQNPLITAATMASSGTYMVISTNTNGCQSSASFNIEVTAAPVVNLVANDVCEGSTLQLLETGGGALSWLWSGPNGFSSTEQNPEIPAVTNAASGTYSLTITDANGCTNSASQSIEIDTLPELSIQNLNAQFCKDITAPVQISGNQSGGTFSLNLGQGLSDLGNGTAELLIADLPPNSYTLSYSFTDQNGCSNSEAQDFEVLDLPQIEAMSNAPLCNGEILNLSETGGEALTWSWNGPGGFISDDQNPTLSGAGVQAGIYTLEITDANSCRNSAELEVTFSPGIAFLGKFLTPVMAWVGDTVHFIEISETDVAPGAFSWTFGDGGSSAERDPTHSYAASGNYEVQVEVFDQACGNLSAAKTVVINQCRLTALDGGSMFAQISPNPTAGDFRLTIELVQRDDLLIQLFDLRGVLLETREKRRALRMEESFFIQQSGVYILKIKTANLQENRVFKVVVSGN